ncbi:hypothetical protein FA10DRAFT_289533 [Acaromyces ingoldii]|uniref:Uncharacterized protein n=1 Tax=Acaromyces ingoldii TaxID=215250 RepID=A0A316YBP1_9BASI|nr:hypothetical protein FA10DRAFT_289533 [Acaromyces ingoldii]PWN86689.1 hypothetical protein FA10DRAFT_289533 [Acaromyces ingoldii]
MVTEHLLLASPLSQTTSIRFGQLSGTLGTATTGARQTGCHCSSGATTSLDAFPMAKLLRFFSVGPAALSGGKHLDTSRA